MYSSSDDLKIFYQARTTLHVRTPQFSMHIFAASAQSRSQSLQNVPLDKGNADSGNDDSYRATRAGNFLGCDVL